MEPNWLQSLFMGLVSGFTEFLPVSAEAHRLLFQKMTGIGEEALLLSFAAQVASLLALLLACYPKVLKLARERRLAKIPPKQRKRQPDGRLLLDLRLLCCGWPFAFLSLMAYMILANFIPDIWVMSAILTVNGLVLFLQERFPQGNKDSRSFSVLDSVLLGILSAFSAVPGLSGIACSTTYGKIRGGDGSYILDMCLLLAVPVLTLLVIANGYSILSGGFAISAALAMKCAACAVAAFISAYYAIILMRFLAYRVGFSGFAYYCWSVALFSFILYLML